MSPGGNRSRNGSHFRCEWKLFENHLIFMSAPCLSGSAVKLEEAGQSLAIPPPPPHPPPPPAWPTVFKCETCNLEFLLKDHLIQHTAESHSPQFDTVTSG
eukprot:333880_1